VFNLDTLIEEGMIDPEDKKLFRYAETAREAWDSILDWYAERGQPLVDNPEAARPVVA
jgi:predicted Rossmann-fold nucleotide-binding protein